MEVNFNIESGDKVKKRLTAGYRARRNFLVAELFGAIVFSTPVLSGRTRGGWRISIGTPPQEEKINLDPVGFDTINEQLGNLKGAGAFKDVYIYNRTPYVDELERGSSGQAPEGMVRVNVAAFKAQHGDVE